MDRLPPRTTREKMVEAEQRKRLLANSILIRIRDELSNQPETEQITYQLKDSVGKLERFVLTHYPQDIADRIRPDRSISLELDESVEPPQLTVTIGQPRGSK